MAINSVKFVCNLFSQETRGRRLLPSARLYAESCGKEPCKPPDPCPKKKDKCPKEDYSNQKDPCGPRGKSPPKNQCPPKKEASKRPNTSKLSAGGITCPPPCCPSPCCPVHPQCPDAGNALICNPAIDGRVAVITGGAFGIGFDYAVAILKNGEKMMLGDNQVEPGKKALCKLIDMFGEDKVAFVKYDVTNHKDMKYCRLYSESKAGKDPCKPQNKCNKKESGPLQSPSPPKDPCFSNTASVSKIPCISRDPVGFVTCPSPCRPPPCCPSTLRCPDVGDKPFCSPAVANKVALITGGANGIGLHCALAILKNGGKVFLGDIQVEAGKEAICKIVEMFGKNRAAFAKCDVTNAKDMECLFQTAKDEFKRIDIVVNNAGIFSNNLIDKLVDINIKGVVRGTFLGFKHMRKNKCGGTIINMGSILGHAPFHGASMYSGSKVFISGFSRSMGHDYFFKQTGVKVMTMCPGVTMTNMVADPDEASMQEGFGKTTDEILAFIDTVPSQTVEECGMHIIKILEANVNGSDWISEGGEVYQIKRVDRHTLRMC